MRAKHTYRVMNGSELAIRQPDVNGWEISWNPDNDRYYVHHKESDTTAATFKDWDNTLQYARSHNPADGLRKPCKLV